MERVGKARRSKVQINESALSISCPSVTTCFVVSGAAVYRTVDGGADWTKESAPVGSAPGFTSAISCGSASDCVIVGVGDQGSEVVTTSDEGKSWTGHVAAERCCLPRRYCLPIFDNVLRGRVFDIHDSICDEHDQSCRSAAILLSRDGGSGWEFQHAPAGPALAAVSCPTITTWVAVGGSSMDPSTGASTTEIPHDTTRSMWTARASPVEPALSLACRAPRSLSVLLSALSRVPLPSPPKMADFIGRRSLSLPTPRAACRKCVRRPHTHDDRVLHDPVHHRREAQDRVAGRRSRHTERRRNRLTRAVDSDWNDGPVIQLALQMSSGSRTKRRPCAFATGPRSVDGITLIQRLQPLAAVLRGLRR